MTKINEIIAIIESTEALTDMSNFDQDKSFKENGINSLDVMSIFLAVEEKYGIKFADDEVEKIASAIDNWS